MANFFKKFLFLAAGVLFLVLSLEVPHWGVEWFRMDEWSSIGQVALQGFLLVMSIAFLVGGVEPDV